jgi:hypothetical protein
VSAANQLRAGLGLLILAGCIAAPARSAPPLASELPCVQTSHSCVPLNPDVTDATVRKTICVLGWTKTVRPPWSYTNGVKAKLLRDRGLDQSQMTAYELDHIVPLALGGHPSERANLVLQDWPQANRKDRLERRLQVLVCRGELKLSAAQSCIAKNWEACAIEHMTR